MNFVGNEEYVKKGEEINKNIRFEKQFHLMLVGKDYV